MNYIGSKLSLIEFLQHTINDISGFQKNSNYVFADLFAGTGIVGSTFKQNGCTVISNDIQHYSYITNKHLIENDSPIDVSLVPYLNNLEGVEGFVYNNYCLGSGSTRNYFSDYNGKKCDAIRIELENLHFTKQISNSQYCYFLSSLINSIDKYANTASVYGAYLKQLKQSASKEMSLNLLPIIDGGKGGKSFNEDANNIISTLSGDVLYLDPPYNARQYCTNYHVLETISRYDNPQLYGKTGLRNYASQKSLFCSKKTVCQSFEDLISKAKFKYTFLSYNNEGLMSLDEIKSIMQKYGKYEMYTKTYRRFRSDKEMSRNHKCNSTVEYLHCLIK